MCSRVSHYGTYASSRTLSRVNRESSRLFTFLGIQPIGSASFASSHSSNSRKRFACSTSNVRKRFRCIASEGRLSRRKIPRIQIGIPDRVTDSRESFSLGRHSCLLQYRKVRATRGGLGPALDIIGDMIDFRLGELWD